MRRAYPRPVPAESGQPAAGADAEDLGNGYNRYESFSTSTDQEERQRAYPWEESSSFSDPHRRSESSRENPEPGTGRGNPSFSSYFREDEEPRRGGAMPSFTAREEPPRRRGGASFSPSPDPFFFRSRPRPPPRTRREEPPFSSRGPPEPHGAMPSFAAREEPSRGRGGASFSSPPDPFFFRSRSRPPPRTRRGSAPFPSRRPPEPHGAMPSFTQRRPEPEPSRPSFIPRDLSPELAARLIMLIESGYSARAAWSIIEREIERGVWPRRPFTEPRPTFASGEGRMPRMPRSSTLSARRQDLFEHLLRIGLSRMEALSIVDEEMGERGPTGWEDSDRYRYRYMPGRGRDEDMFGL